MTFSYSATAVSGAAPEIVDLAIQSLLPTGAPDFDGRIPYVEVNGYSLQRGTLTVEATLRGGSRLVLEATCMPTGGNMYTSREMAESILKTTKEEFEAFSDQLVARITAAADRIEATQHVEIEARSPIVKPMAPGHARSQLSRLLRVREEADGSLVCERPVPEGWLTHTFTVTEDPYGKSVILLHSVLQIPLDNPAATRVRDIAAGFPGTVTANLSRLGARMTPPRELGL